MSKAKTQKKSGKAPKKKPEAPKNDRLFEPIGDFGHLPRGNKPERMAWRLGRMVDLFINIIERLEAGTALLNFVESDDIALPGPDAWALSTILEVGVERLKKLVGVLNADAKRIDRFFSAKADDSATDRAGAKFGIRVGPGMKVWALNPESDGYEQGVLLSTDRHGCFVEPDDGSQRFGACWDNVYVHAAGLVDDGEGTDGEGTDAEAAEVAGAAT